MYFSLLEGERDAGENPSDHPSDRAANQWIRASMTFTGEWSGTFQILTRPSAAREIAANFTGVSDPTEITDQAAGEVLGEMANMVCGSTLSLLGQHKLFDLGSPQIALIAGLKNGSSERHCVERAFRLDSGDTLRFAIASEAFR